MALRSALTLRRTLLAAAALFAAGVWLVVAHASLILAPATPTSTSSVAMRASDFYSKFGVDTNINSGETISSILSELQYLGIYNIRDSIYSEGYAQAFAALAAQGVKLHMDFQGWVSPAPAMSDWLGWLKTYLVTPYPGSVIGVSGPNEVDNTDGAFVYGGLSGMPAANQAQKDLYNGIKADPTLASIPVDMWPLAFATDNAITQQVGDMTAYCDRANMHDYYFPDDYTPSVSAYGDMQVQIPLYLADYRLVCNRAPWVTTETGWVTPYAGGNMFSKEVSEDVQAKLLLVDLFDHAMLPDCQAVYIFDLQWGSEDTSDPGWGVFHDDGTPKISGMAIRNLMAILNDPGANARSFTTGALNYSLSGMPATSGNVVVQKSSGAFDIMIWNETPIWSLSTQSEISIPSSNVTLLLPYAASGQVYDPLQGTSAIANFSDTNLVQLQLSDHPLIVEIE